MLRGMQDEAPNWARTLPQLPRLVHRALKREKTVDLAAVLAQLNATQRRQNRLLALIAVLLLLSLLLHYL